MFIDLGHFCILVFAQDLWKASYKEHMIKNVTNDYLKRGFLMTDFPSFFDPKVKNKDSDACELCSALTPIFNQKLKSNEGFFRFSHDPINESDGFEFVMNILSEDHVKKVSLLVLDRKSYDKKGVIVPRIPGILSKIEQKTIKQSELKSLIEQKNLKYSMFYDIVKGHEFKK